MRYEAELRSYERLSLVEMSKRMSGYLVASAAWIVVVIAACFAPQDEKSASGDSQDAVTYRMPSPALPSKQAFDERRRRYIEAHPDSQVATEAAARVVKAAASENRPIAE